MADTAADIGGRRAPSLLDRARQFKPRIRGIPLSAEKIDLACSWLRSEVSLSAVQHVLGKKHANDVYLVIARSLRAAFQQGLLIEQTNGQATHGGTGR